MFWSPFCTWRLLLSSGTTALTKRALFASAVSSSMVRLTLLPLATPRMKLWPGYTLNSVGPSAWMRSWTDFCAPEPSAIIVITAPTPMMMPSIVSSDRSLFARSASSATMTISPSSMLVLRRPAAAALLAQSRQPTAGHVLEPVLEVLLRLHQRRAGQQQHGVLLR